MEFSTVHRFALESMHQISLAHDAGNYPATALMTTEPHQGLTSRSQIIQL